MYKFLTIGIIVFCSFHSSSFSMENLTDEKEIVYPLKQDAKKRFYLNIETEDRILYERDYEGTIGMEILPRENKAIKIGKIDFNSPKKIKGFSIDIGEFHIDKEQSDSDFIKTINNSNPVTYVLYHAEEHIEKNMNSGVIEIETLNRTKFIKYSQAVSITFNPRNNTPIHIGNRNIKSPERLKKIIAHKIQIGDFFIDTEQSENDFISSVKSFDSIAYKAKQEQL